MMKFVLLVLLVTTIVAAVFLANSRRKPSLGATSSQNDSSAVEVARKQDLEFSQSMRMRLLSGGPGDFGVLAKDGFWGVLMEMGFPEGTATLVALRDGTASLYFGPGGGIIGGGSHQNVRKIVEEFCDLAQEYAEKGGAVTDFPKPARGNTRFYFLLDEGVRSSEEVDEVLGRGNHPLSTLFFSGHDLISALRPLLENQPDSATKG